MREEIHIRITMQRRWAVWLLGGLVLSGATQELGSEVLTLDTYYPAPYGVYTEMRTVGKTTLAETPSGQVGIGTTSPAYKLDVRGGDAYVSGSMTTGSDVSAGGNLSVTGQGYVGGNLGIGVSPGNKLDVNGIARFRDYVDLTCATKAFGAAGVVNCDSGYSLLGANYSTSGPQFNLGWVTDGADYYKSSIPTTGTLICCKYGD